LWNALTGKKKSFGCKIFEAKNKIATGKKREQSQITQQLFNQRVLLNRKKNGKNHRHDNNQWLHTETKQRTV